MARLRQVVHTSCLPKTPGAFHPTIPTPVSPTPRVSRPRNRWGSTRLSATLAGVATTA
jgi:hypothetical protein